MVVLADIDELNRSGPIQHKRCGVRDPNLDALWSFLQNAQLRNQSTLGIRQKKNPLSQTQFVDEDPGALVDLCPRHHPDNPQIRRRVECFSQLHEPRLGIGSPIHAAFEGHQNTMSQKIFSRHGLAVEIDESERGKTLPD